MKEIKNVKEKLSSERKMVKAYEAYQRYEAMLEVYKRMDSDNLIANHSKPFDQVKKWVKEAGFNTEAEYKMLIQFMDVVEQKMKKRPQGKLDDLTTKKGRETIAEVISKTQNHTHLKECDLRIVAVAKCYGLYEVMNDAEAKSSLEIVKMLRENQVPIHIYEAACEKKKNYDRNNRGELYNHSREKEVDSMVHMAAAALEIGPGEAERDLAVLGAIRGKKFENELDKYVKIEKEEVSCAVLDTIIMDDRLTDAQKKILIENEYNKVAQNNKFKEGVIKQWMNEGKKLKDMPENYRKRNGVVILGEEDEKERA